MRGDHSNAICWFFFQVLLCSRSRLKDDKKSKVLILLLSRPLCLLLHPHQLSPVKFFQAQAAIQRVDWLEKITEATRRERVREKKEGCQADDRRFSSFVPYPNKRGMKRHESKQKSSERRCFLRKTCSDFVAVVDTLKTTGIIYSLFILIYLPFLIAARAPVSNLNWAKESWFNK